MILLGLREMNFRFLFALEVLFANTPDLIRIRYGNMRIFPADFIHGGGFKNTRSTGNLRIQLLIIDDGHKLYHP